GPHRSVPVGMAVLRAQLEFAEKPASWALLQVLVPDGPSALGAADGDGRVTVIFGYPEPPGLDLAAGAPATVALSAQTWTLGLRAYFGSSGPDPVLPVAPPDSVP